MVKHNNQIPNIHCKKKYQQSSRGPLKVKLALNQATRKKSRRLKRQAAPKFPKLQPIVHCPTQKYSAKVRLGKGFTLEELKAAKLHPSYAMSVGIAIDWRRRNKSEESLALNVARLEEYKKNLIILKKGEAAPKIVPKAVQPIVKAPAEIVMQEITADMKAFKAYTTMRVAAAENRVAGQRIAVEIRKKKEG
jgi:large subunit ribosomal protein L13e